MISKRIICNIIFKRVRAHLFSQLNGFKYCYITIIPFNIYHLFAL